MKYPMCVALLVFLALLSLAAAIITTRFLQPGRRSTPEARAVELVKDCVEKEPETYKAVWGSPLEFGRASVQMSEPEGAYVHVPEKSPKGKPQGIAVWINLRTRYCKELYQE